MIVDGPRFPAEHRREIVLRKLSLIARAAEAVSPGANITPREILDHWVEETELAGGTPEAASEVLDRLVEDARAVLGE